MDIARFGPRFLGFGTKWNQKFLVSKMAEQGAARAVLVQAAIELGLGVWQAGQNVETALTAAGYTRTVIDGVLNYIRDDPETAAREADLTQQSYSQGSMSSQTTKKARLGGTRRSTIPVAPKVKKYVKKCMDKLVEVKYYQGTMAITDISASGTVHGGTLSSIQQGDGDSQRDGNIVKLKSYSFRFDISDAISANSIVRVILVWDKQCNGANGTVADVLATTASNSGYNHDLVVGHGGGRFNILFDKTYTLRPSIATTSTVQHVTGSVNLEGKHARYDANAGAVTDLTSGNIFWIFIGSGATADMAGYQTIKFVDN